MLLGSRVLVFIVFWSGFRVVVELRGGEVGFGFIGGCRLERFVRFTI